jgi:hypothetical protein
MPVINEVMYHHPTRWVEIYNPTQYAFNLFGWRLQTASTQFNTIFTFPNIVLQPDSYIVICETNTEFSDFTANLLLLDGGIATTGVRLISQDGSYTDTILYGSPNTHYLPDDRDTPAIDFVPTVPPGYSLARNPNGLDTNSVTDWSACDSPSPGLPNFMYIDLGISDIFITQNHGGHNLHIVIHDLSTSFVDKTQLILKVDINEVCVYNATPNLLIDGNLMTFELPVTLVPNATNTIKAEISYPQNQNTADIVKILNFWHGMYPIIINELQFQPRSPEPEWIEFYNRSDQPQEIINAFIQNASGRRAYFSATIEPKDYLIICQNISAFVSIHPDVDIEKVLQPTTWATLVNARDTIQLFLTEELKVDSVSYVGVASQHGRSLERVNPYWDENITWLYTLSEQNSTPLARNSRTPAQIDARIVSVTIEVIDGRLQHAVTVETTGLSSNFEATLTLHHRDESMADFEYILERNIYMGYETEVSLSTPFPTGTGYHYYMYRLLFHGEPAVFYRSFLHERPPVVINEIMFNAHIDEPRWVEFISLRDAMPEEGLVFTVNTHEIHLPHWEGEYALMTVNQSDVAFLQSHYHIPESVPIFTGLRSLNIAGATVGLIDYDGNLYEHFSYTPDFSRLRGVSAERISPMLPPMAQNWTASKVGSTPGQRNSVYMDIVPTENKLSIQNNPFSPYKNESCIINVNASEQKVRVEIIVFDIKGREVIKVADREIVSGSYSFLWNGHDKNRKPVIPGAYPVLVSVQNMNGREILREKRVLYVGH